MNTNPTEKWFGQSSPKVRKEIDWPRLTIKSLLFVIGILATLLIFQNWSTRNGNSVQGGPAVHLMPGGDPGNPGSYLTVGIHSRDEWDQAYNKAITWLMTHPKGTLIPVFDPNAWRADVREEKRKDYWKKYPNGKEEQLRDDTNERKPVKGLMQQQYEESLRETARDGDLGPHEKEQYKELLREDAENATPTPIPTQKATAMPDF